MPKKSTSFRLSDMALAVLKEKTRQFSVSATAVLEAVLKDLAPSTAEEKNLQRMARREAMERYLNDHPNATLRQAWNHGFSCGWSQFQTRKKDNLFVRHLTGK